MGNNIFLIVYSVVYYDYDKKEKTRRKIIIWQLLLVLGIN